MPTPFDHLEQFKSLSPEVQGKIVERFQQLPEEDKQTVMSKINTPMQVRDADPGLENVSLTPLQKTAMEEQGPEDIATGLAAKGFDPKLAAAAGTAFRMIPDILMSLPAGKAAKPVLEGTEMAAKKGLEAGSSLVNAIKSTGSKEVERLTVKAAELPIKQAAKRELAEETRKVAGKAIGEAEKALNIGQANTSAAARRVAINTPEKIVKFADRADRLAQKGADKLAKMASPESLQFYRKTAEDALKKSGNTLAAESKNKLYAVKKVFTEAIAKTKEGTAAGFDKAMQQYDDIQRVINELPKEAKREKQLLKVALEKAKRTASEQARTRKFAGGVAVTAATAAIGRGIAKKVTGQ